MWEKSWVKEEEEGNFQFWTPTSFYGDKKKQTNKSIIATVAPNLFAFHNIFFLSALPQHSLCVIGGPQPFGKFVHGFQND